MILSDIQHIMESWAPHQIARDRDNVGIQLGSKKQRIRKIVVALDVNENVVKEAMRKRADLIISHHPLLFHSLNKISTDDRIGRIVTQLTLNHIAVYSAHTNLDFTKGGVSTALAHRLGLSNVKVLQQNQQVYNKIVVFVPADYADTVITAMSNAGAGSLGHYDNCSFSSEGRGTFRARKEAKPFIGSIGTMEYVKEMRLEMIAPSWRTRSILEAMRASHPYEEIAHDVYELVNTSTEYGAGAIGEYEKPLSTKKFFSAIKQQLRASALRYGGNQIRTIRRVAVCGGSGSDLLSKAIEHRADAFITADIRYHSFEESANSILLVDAGHFETEVPILHHVVEYLKAECAKYTSGIQVWTSTVTRNPVNYYL